MPFLNEECSWLSTPRIAVEARRPPCCVSEKHEPQPHRLQDRLAPALDTKLDVKLA